MPLINIQPKEMENGDRVTFYTNTVGTVQETFTFKAEQETIILRNKGTKKIYYTIGANSGTLERSEYIRLDGVFSSVALRSENGTQAFEIWADEVGTAGISPAAINSLDTKVQKLTSDLAQIANKPFKNYLVHKGISFEDFEDIAPFTVNSCTKSAETNIKKTGQQALKIQGNAGASSFYVQKSITLKLADLGVLGMNVYIEDVSKISEFHLYLFNTLSSNYMRLKLLSTQLRNGWNNIKVNQSDFTVTGTGSFSADFVAYRITVVPVTGQTPFVVVDDFRREPQGQTKVIFTFDDGSTGVPDNAKPVMDAKGYKGCIGAVATYVEGTNTGYMRLPALVKLYGAGWDIVSHGYSHMTLTEVSDAEITTELTNMKNWLLANGFERSADFHIYAGSGGFNEHVHDVVKSLNLFKMARTTNAGLVAPPLDSPLALRSSYYTTVVAMKADIDKAIATGQSIILYFHNIVTDNPNDMRTLVGEFQQIVDYISLKKLDVVTMSEFWNGL